MGLSRASELPFESLHRFVKKVKGDAQENVQKRGPDWFCSDTLAQRKKRSLQAAPATVQRLSEALTLSGTTAHGDSQGSNAQGDKVRVLQHKKDM